MHLVSIPLVGAGFFPPKDIDIPILVDDFADDAHDDVLTFPLPYI